MIGRTDDDAGTNLLVLLQNCNFNLFVLKISFGSILSFNRSSISSLSYLIKTNQLINYIFRIMIIQIDA